MSLKEKVIIVTGGTSGIGEACSRHFAALGARVVIASNQADPGQNLEKELRAAGQEVRFVFTDVAREESVQALIQRAVEFYGRIDGIHCNAGVWAAGTVTDFNEAVWNALARKGLARSAWPNAITLTAAGLGYDTGLAETIFHSSGH